MITCIAVDDEPLALEVIKKNCDKTPALQLIQTFTDPFAAADFLKKTKVDLLFLDIQMPELNGIQLYKSLKDPPPVIFTTAFGEYALEGFNLNALDYLLKPIEYSRFLRAINKVELLQAASNGETQQRQDDFMFLKIDCKLVKVEFKDVLYFEALDDYIKVITTTSAKPLLTLMPMKNLMTKLPPSRFARVHRSYIVPLLKIESVHNKRIKIGEKYIPIGENFSSAFFEALNSI